MFFLNGLIIFLPILIVGFIFIKAQKKFLRLYRVKKNPPYPVTEEERRKEFYNNPIKFFFNIPITTNKLWKEAFKHHKDSELNNAAKEVRKWFYITITIFIICCILLAFI